MPDGTIECMPERMPNRMSKYMSDRTPDVMSEYMSEIMSAGGDYSKKYILNYFKGSGSNTGAAQNGSRI